VRKQSHKLHVLHCHSQIDGKPQCLTSPHCLLLLLLQVAVTGVSTANATAQGTVSVKITSELLLLPAVQHWPEVSYRVVLMRAFMCGQLAILHSCKM
jgi:hypothetical protein